MTHSLETLDPIGPSVLDDDDLTEEVVASVLRRRIGADNPCVSALAQEITSHLRLYQVHKLEGLA